MTIQGILHSQTLSRNNIEIVKDNRLILLKTRVVQAVSNQLIAKMLPGAKVRTVMKCK